MWGDKLKNFRFLRCTLVFKFLLNGNPFSVGRLIAWWSPFHDERGSRQPILKKPHITAYPHVEIDLGTKVTCQLRIPYASMYSHVDQLLGVQPYGRLFVHVLNGMGDVTSGTTANLEIFAFMEDVSLDIPTYTDQLGAQVFSLKTFEKPVEPKAPMKVIHVKQTQSSKEAAVRSKEGVISGGAQKIGRFAKAFSDVPAVGEIAKPVAWLADAVAGVSSLLGFSKPISLESTQPFSNNPIKGYTNSEGLCEANVLAANPKNEIVPSYECFGTKADEMDINYIVSRYSLFRSITWPTSIGTLSPRLIIPVHPGICGDDGLGPPSLGFQSTPLSFVASMARYWRGTINIRLSIVKNPYYSGRLGICFIPGWNYIDVLNNWSSGLNISTNGLDMLPKIIWDVKEDNDITFAIPFQAQTQFCRVRMSDQGHVDDMTTDTAPGVLVVYVSTPLRAPTSCPDVVPINCWVAGGHDIQFAMFDMARYSPIATNRGPPTEEDIALMDLKDKSMIAHKKTQMYKVEKSTFEHQQTEKIPEGLSLLEVDPSIPTYPLESCIGEAVTNLAYLCRRICHYTPTMSFQAYNMLLDPAYFFQPPVTTEGVDFRINQNPLHYISYMYVFYRGSRRYLIQPQFFGKPDFADSQPPNQALIARTDQLYSTSPLWITAPVNRWRSGQFEARAYGNILPALTFQAPFYSNVPMQLISDNYITAQHLRAVYAIEVQPTGGTLSLQAAPYLQVLTGGGDDFRFGYAVGTPYLYDYGG